MNPESFWQDFYASFWQHPVLLWVAVGITAVVVLSLPLDRGMRRYCLLLLLLSACDAWLTSNLVPGLGRLSGLAASAVPLFFVLAGDLRFLLLVSSAEGGGRMRLTPGRVLAAVALTCIVPLLSQGLMAVFPKALQEPRLLYLLYEIGFVLLTIHLLVFHPRLLSLAWLRSVAYFVVLYYSLWAVADLVILQFGADWGYGLRIVPNLLYYGGLIAAIAWNASRARSEATT